MKGRYYSGNLGLAGRIILKSDYREMGLESADWIYLARGRDLWRAVVNTAMDLRVP
jgi:hypothetical protein